MRWRIIVRDVTTDWTAKLGAIDTAVDRAAWTPIRAFSSEVGPGSREENASEQKG